eukprot:scaffold1271_cov167-Amphora_coffeaeformis.AAC.7
MSTADHDWIMGLMQHRVRRGSSSRQLVAPVSPASQRVSLTKQVSTRSRLMSDNIVRKLEVSPQQQDKMQVRKPTLNRRFTASTCDGKQVPRFDIPFEIRVPISNDDERDSCDDVSEVSLEGDLYCYQGQSCCIDDEPVSCSTGSMVGGSSPTTPRVEQLVWGMTTVCLDDQPVWPSNEGSPMKKSERSYFEEAPVHMLALDDEREDSATQLLSTKTLFGSSEERRGQRFVR